MIGTNIIDIILLPHYQLVSSGQFLTLSKFTLNWKMGETVINSHVLYCSINTLKASLTITYSNQNMQDERFKNAWRKNS